MKMTSSGLRLSASDVANFLACQHLARLDLLRARGELYPPYESDLGFQELVERGEAHERAVLGRFRADGCHVAEIAGGNGGRRGAGHAARHPGRCGRDLPGRAAQ